jgi:hypothetical protein
MKFSMKGLELVTFKYRLHNRGDRMGRLDCIYIYLLIYHSFYMYKGYGV